MTTVDADADRAAALAIAPGHGAITLRPTLPADGPALRAFCEALAPPDLRLFGAGAPSAAELALGGGGAAAFGLVALAGQGAHSVPVALARLCSDPDGVAGEFALIVEPALRRRGVGRRMLTRLLAQARRRGLLLVRSAALPGNAAMLGLARACGFQLLPAADGTVELVRLLAPVGARGVQRIRLD